MLKQHSFFSIWGAYMNMLKAISGGWSNPFLFTIVNNVETYKITPFERPKSGIWFRMTSLNSIASKKRLANHN